MAARVKTKRRETFRQQFEKLYRENQQKIFARPACWHPKFT